jgi:hypothetical protein
MIGWRAAAAGIATKLGNHSFRVTGITAYLKNGGTLERAAAMANHASTRTTHLYDRRRDDVSRDEVERIAIQEANLAKFLRDMNVFLEKETVLDYALNRSRATRARTYACGSPHNLGVEYAPELTAKFCATCGACMLCFDQRRLSLTGFISAGHGYTPPNHCRNCGAPPFP